MFFANLLISVIRISDERLHMLSLKYPIWHSWMRQFSFLDSHLFASLRDIFVFC